MRNQSIGRIGIALVAIVVVVGCDTPPTAVGPGGPSMEQLAAKLQGKAPEPPPKAADPEPVENENEVVDTQPPDGGRGGADPATVPDGAKAASDRGPTAARRGYLGAISSANRNIREALSDVSWQKSVQLFEAENGRKPRDTQEFLERIQREGTPLPQIDPGFTYLYAPDEGQFGQLYQVPIDDAGGDRSTGR